MARLRSAPSVLNAPPATKTTRPALKEKTNNAITKLPVHEKDGNIDELVRPTRSRRGNGGKQAQNDNDLRMTGGLGHTETERQTLLPTEHPTTTDELAKSDEQPPPPTAKTNRRPPRMTRKAVQNEAESEVLQDVKKRTLAGTGKTTAPKKAAPESLVETPATRTQPTAAQNQVPATHERSEFSLSPSPPPKGKLSAVKDKRTSIAQNESSKKAQATPSAESSILALKNFKRRPRQPSMLQMVQQRTASARPSAVNLQAKDDSNVFDIVDDIVDDEAFAPDAEGTPARLRAKPRLSAARKDLSVSRLSMISKKKRKSDDADLTSSAASALKSKRQKSTSAQRFNDSDVDLLTSVPSAELQHNISDGALLTSAPTRSSSTARRVTPQPQITSDPQVINAKSSSTPPSDPPSDITQTDRDAAPVDIQTGEQRLSDADFVEIDQLDDPEDQDVPNGTVAEPASSSPLRSPKAIVDSLTLVSRLAKRNKAGKSKAKPMTTEALQSLLPKRRQPVKRTARVSEYDIESDSDQGGEGTEAERGAKSRRQTKTAQSKGKKVIIAPKGKPGQSKAVLSNRKSSAPPARKSTARPAAAKKPGKTYSRAPTTTSDKENEGDDDGFESLDENDESALPDTSISMDEASHSKELAAARKKFAQVDDWDMEFESMSIQEGRSSSQEWR